MRHHVLHKCKAAPTKNTVALLQKQQTALQKQNTEIKKELAELKTAVAAPATNYVSITLILNNFAEEDTEHLTDSDIRAILNSCVDNPNYRTADAAHAIVAALGEAIFANPACEENYTACLVSRKTDRACIFRDEEWKMGPAAILQRNMASRIVDYYQKRQFTTWRKFDQVTDYFVHNREEILTNNQLRQVLLRTGKLLQERDPKMMEELLRNFKSAMKKKSTPSGQAGSKVSAARAI